MSTTSRVSVSALGIIAAASLASAQTTAPIYEEFDAFFENSWGSFPFANENLDDFPFVFYDGLPAGAFGVIGDASVFDMINTLDIIHFVGMSPDGYVMYGDVGVIEARVNTRVQDPGVDGGVFSLRAVTPGYNAASAGIYHTEGGGAFPWRFRYGSTIDETLSAGTGVVLQDNTWYRVRLDNSGPLLRAALLTDSGQLISSHTFSHTLGDLQIGGPGIYLTVLQDAFSPSSPVPVRAAVDWVSVSVGPCVADLALPPGVLDFSDVVAFLGAFSMQDPGADLAPPFGSLDFNDLLAFLQAFAAGCP